MKRIVDDIVEGIDDTAEEDASGGKPKEEKVRKPRPAPPPANAPMDMKGLAKGASAEGGKKSNPLPKILLFVIPIVLIGVFITMVFLNLFGLRGIMGGIFTEPLINAVVWFDPDFTSIEKSIRDAGDRREAALDIREASIAEYEARQKEIFDALNEREGQLDRRSAALDRREQNLEVEAAPELPVYERTLTPEEIVNLQSLSRTYANMDAESAAEIMAELYSLEDMATILFYMTERKAAPILEAMNPELAARVTELLIGSR